MRVPIYEKWWTDPRRLKLQTLVGEREADGVAVHFWRMAYWYQTYRGVDCIPLDDFQGFPSLSPPSVSSKIPDWQAFLDCNLAVIKEGFVYVRGLSEECRQNDGRPPHAPHARSEGACV